MKRGPAFPFTAVTGMETAKHALTLLAVDPQLAGVVIAGGPGLAKTLLARGFAELMGGAPWVEAPSGITEDRLIGGLDLERTLAQGRRTPAPGLLAEASGGTLYADGINRLGRAVSRQIAAALGSGVVRVERDGISTRRRSEFCLVGVYDPAGGPVDPALFDSAAMHVSVEGHESAGRRLAVLRSVDSFSRDPAGFAARHAEPMRALRARLASARRRLPHVEPGEEWLERLSRAAAEAGIEGHRAEIFGARLMRARAAWKGRDRPEEGDFRAALELVVAPRARHVPHPASPADSKQSAGPSGTDRDRMLAPEECLLPCDVIEFHAGNVHPGRRSVRSRRAPAARGRYVRATAEKPAAPTIAVEATLRAAAPFQRLRGAAGLPIRIEGGDVRYKRFEAQPGGLLVFVADASGSMALNRMGQAKGAALRLLQEAYRRRDRVALVGFRGNRAEVLLAPSRSTEAAARAFRNLPAGGGTPLAAGLSAALDLARRGRQSERRDPLLVIITDAGANVGRGGAVWEEIADVARRVRAEGIASVVLDTGRRFVSAGDAGRLAAMLGGRHMVLP